jgi:hypothetical protein
MINYKEKYGLLDHLNKNNVFFRMADNVKIFESSKPDSEVQAIIDNYDPLILLKSEAKARIVEQSQAYMQQVESKYPSFERATWPTQKAEIEAWGLDNTSLTPLLNNIAIARKMDRVTLLGRTLAKVQVYNTQAAYLAGTRQKLEDEIDNSTDLDFISSINFEA